MATLSRRKNNIWLIQFPDLETGKRANIYLPNMRRSDASTIKGHLEHLIVGKVQGIPVPLSTAQWITAQGDAMLRKLAKANLVEGQQEAKKASAPTARLELGNVMDQYIAARTDIKPRTKINLEQCRRVMLEFFGHIDIRTINKGTGNDWRRKMAETLAQATISGHIKKAREVFADATDRNLIAENPFLKVKAGTQKNSARLRYIPAGDINKAIDACPDAEWRLIFAMARFGGLRCPSEFLPLQWSDVNRETNRITITSSKTEHNPGGESRVIPIFPELREPLMELFDQAKEGGSPFVFAQHRGVQNWRTRAEKIIRRAGLVQWERIFQNLRASCEIDLVAKFPLPVACQWIGNSEAVAMAHYLKATDDDYDRAAGVEKSTVKSAAETHGNGRKYMPSTNEKPPFFRGNEENYTPKGSRTAYDSAEDLIGIRKVLQKALRRQTDRLASFRPAAIAQIQRAIQDARAAGAARRGA